jgi:hypothetical protein
VALYDITAEVLHSPNPYNAADYTIDFKYSVNAWSSRIKALLSWHFIQLLDGKTLWVVQIPNTGPVEFFPAVTDGPFVVV